MAEGTMPWQVESSKGNNPDEHFKYQYHPGGDRSKAPKDAPSALNSVIVPNVNLPKVCPSLIFHISDSRITNSSRLVTAREIQQVGKGWILRVIDMDMVSKRPQFVQGCMYICSLLRMLELFKLGCQGR